MTHSNAEISRKYHEVKIWSKPSARMILYAVDDYHTDYVNGKPVYCMDFLYEKEVDIRDFLMKRMNDQADG